MKVIWSPNNSRFCAAFLFKSKLENIKKILRRRIEFFKKTNSWIYPIIFSYIYFLWEYWLNNYILNYLPFFPSKKTWNLSLVIFLEHFLLLLYLLIFKNHQSTIYTDSVDDCLWSEKHTEWIRWRSEPSSTHPKWWHHRFSSESFCDM